MRFIALLLATVLTSTASFAQPQPGPAPTAMEEILSQRLNAETNRGFQCDVAAVSLQRRVAELQKQIDDLKKPAAADKPKP